MGKFNVKKQSLAQTTRTTNYEGGLAFTLTPKLDLAIRSATCLINEPKFYGSSDAEIEELKNLVKKVAEIDPEFILQLAAYARNELYLRSLPQFLLVEALQYDQCKKYVRAYMPNIIVRADEICEALALFIAKNGKIGTEGTASLPHCFRNGLLDCLRKFNAFQIAKYDSSKNTVRYRDVLRLLHPTPMDETEDQLFAQIISDTLPTPETWETYISANGSTKESWEHIVPKMAYMALLRNLRNLLQKGVSAKHIDNVITKLCSREEVLKSKQFPFRFLSAHRELEKAEVSDPFLKQKVMDALNKAIEISVSNVDVIEGRTAIFVDNSGSMSSATVSRMSNVTAKDIAGVMGALVSKIAGESIIGVFGSTYKTVSISGMGIIDGARKLSNTSVGHSTEAYLTLQYLNDNKIFVDRIILLSDMQCYDSSSYNMDDKNTLYYQFKEYRKNINPNAKLYSIDLRGYGTSQFPERTKGVALLAGWSDKILKFINVYEEALNSTAFIDAIKNY